MSVQVGIGILTANARQGGLGGNRANFARLIRAAANAKQDCFVYAIEPDGQVSVYRRDHQQRTFVRTEAALPSVLYNRIPTRRLEHSQAVKERMNTFRTEGVVITNPRFLQKDEVLDLWQQSSALRTFVPTAAPLTYPLQVASFLDEHRTVYVKPVDGMAGLGIMQLRQGDDGVVMRLQRPGRAPKGRRMTRAQAVRFVWGKAAGTRYVLQAGADVAKYDGRRFDFRLLAHVHEDEQMHITGYGIRVGPVGGVTTHVPNGGQVLAPDTVLQHVFGTRANQVRDHVLEVATMAANRVAALPGVWSECSLDIGVTRDGRACLFEANAKPMKFDEPAIERAAKRQVVARLLGLGQ